MNRRKSKHKEKLNIAMFGQKRIPSREGGVEIVVEELCTRMVAQGYNVTCYNRGGHHVSGSEFDSKRLGSWVLNTVIHRQNDEWQTVAWWRKYAVSAIIDEEIKGASVMAIKYTEEQLNSVDKSLLVQMFLNQQLLFYSKRKIIRRIATN